MCWCIFWQTAILSKNALVIEQLAAVNTIVFDKTGTITTKKNRLVYEGTAFESKFKLIKKCLVKSSLSRMLYDFYLIVKRV
jgi:Cu+-exporting ATPase